MRICFFTQQYRKLWSGLGTYATHLSDSLVAAGHEVLVVCPEEADREPPPGVQVMTLPKLSRDPSHGQWFSLAFKFSREIPSLISSHRFDLIHFADAREALFCPRLPIPVIGTVHDSYFAESSANPISFYRSYYDWVKRYLYYRAVHKLEPRAFSKLNGVIANSRYVRQSLMRNYHLPDSFIKVIHLGIPSHPTPVVEPCTPRNGKGFQLLFVGANFQRKGLPTIIRALPQILAHHAGTRLIVIGKDPNEKAVRKLCLKLNVHDYVQFLGWLPHEEVKNHYRRSDLFVMPSLLEGFGLVFLESMASGVPVIGSTAGGTCELIEDGINGFLVRPLDSKTLAQKACMLLENPSLRTQFIEQGYQTVGRFSLQRMVDETVGYYRDMIN